MTCVFAENSSDDDDEEEEEPAYQRPAKQMRGANSADVHTPHKPLVKMTYIAPGSKMVMLTDGDSPMATAQTANSKALKPL